MVAATIIVLLLLLILARVPVGFAILAAGIAGLAGLGGLGLVNGILATIPATSVMNYSLSAAPAFIFMAQLVLLSGLLDSLFDAARTVVGRVRGGTGVASIGAGTAFAAVSGSSTASAATLASTSTTKMIEEGYTPRTAAGVVAVVGTLAAMIPPSIILVFYAVTAEVSVGEVLIAGFLPGLIIAAAIVVTLYVVIIGDTDAAPQGQRYTMAEKGRSLLRSAPILLLFAAVVGAIYLGLATPTEAASLGCVTAFALVVARGRCTRTGLATAVVETVKTSAMIFVILVGAHVFGHFLTEVRVTPTLVGWVGDLAMPSIAIMACIGFIYLVLGFFMDQIAILALTVPVTLPLIESLGYDPIWFGIFVVLLAEVGMVTPPLGLNVFVVARTAGRPVEEVFRGAFPFVIAMVTVAALFLIFPEIVLWIPESR